MSETPYQNKAHIATIVAACATIVAAIVASLSLGIGFFQFKNTQQVTRETLRLQQEMLTHDREVKAIELFIKFNEIQEAVKPRARKRNAETDAEFWRGNILLTISESVFRLTKGDAAWRATVIFMLQAQIESKESFQLDCKTLDKDFVDLVREVVKKEVCF